MKRFLYAFIIFAFVLTPFGAFAETGTSKAHRTMIPQGDSEQNLGSEPATWKFLYVTALPTINYAVCTDAGDVTYTLTLSDYPDLAAGLILYFVASTPNTTGTANISYNGTVDSLKSLNNATPAADYIESSQAVQIMFDGTNWQLLTPDANP